MLKKLPSHLAKVAVTRLVVTSPRKKRSRAQSRAVLLPNIAGREASELRPQDPHILGGTSGCSQTVLRSRTANLHSDCTKRASANAEKTHRACHEVLARTCAGLWKTAHMKLKWAMFHTWQITMLSLFLEGVPHHRKNQHRITQNVCLGVVCLQRILSLNMFSNLAIDVFFELGQPLSWGNWNWVSQFSIRNPGCLFCLPLSFGSLKRFHLPVWVCGSLNGS